MLFDDFPRTNTKPPEPGEPLYPFLNGAAGEYWQSVRDMLTSWLSQYPHDEQATLIARFRRTDRRGFLGAFWELYLYETFRRLGFRIELHPEIVATTHRPDFRLQRGAEAFYVEAVTIYEPQAHSLEEARLAPLREVVSQIQTPNFGVSVDARQIASAPLPLERLSRAIEEWLSSLENESDSSPTRGGGSALRWQEDGWMLMFRPVQRSADISEESGEREYGKSKARTEVVDDSRSIRNRLGGKARVYGRRFEEPFLIALTSYRPSHGPDTALRALFGPARDHPEMMRARVIARSRATSSNGLWVTHTGADYQDVSAVLTAFDLMPWSVSLSRPWLIANPWASHPLQLELPFNRFDVDAATGEIDAVESDFEPHRLFGLQPD